MLLKLFATSKAPLVTILTALALGASLFSGSTAQALDKESQEALDKTKRLLTTPSERNEAIKNDQQAKEAHARVQALGGSSQQTEKVYDISSQVMDKMVKDANGDPAKMQEMMANAQKNPEAFFKSLSTEQQQAIERLAKELEAARK